MRAVPPCGLDPWSIAALELEDLHRRWLHIELRSPFLDRDLREFCFSLPSASRESGAGTKILLRHALGRIPGFPVEIRERSDKAEFSALFRQTWLAHGTAACRCAGETLKGRVRKGQTESWAKEISQKKLSILVKYLWTAWHGYAISLWLAGGESCFAGADEPQTQTAWER
jgi:hypothetical protein